MARALRLEYEGARYHVMCHGNQQRNIFNAQSDVDLFLKTLGEVCIRNALIVHAWCTMSNHYHMLLETPEANLVDAMKWFQGTFTQRYNAVHQLAGHVYQGRYKAKIIDGSDPAYFRNVSEYIHLNPAEAGLVETGHLEKYAWSSYPVYLQSGAKRPDWLEVKEVLSCCGFTADTPAQRRRYADYMQEKCDEVLFKKEGEGMPDEWRHMDRGWIHGGKAFRKECIELLDTGGRTARVEELEQKRDVGEATAEEVLQQCLQHFKLTREALKKLAKSDPRKMLIAGVLRYHFPVRAQWVSDQLYMGHFTTVSRAMRFYDEVQGKWLKEKKRILKFIG